MDAIELAWAAGFFDGEGSTVVLRTGKSALRPDGYPSLMLKVGQKDRRPLDRFRAALGIGRIYGPYRDMHQWQVNGQAASAALDLLMPYLSAPKREQAEHAQATLRRELADQPLHRSTLREQIIHLHTEGRSAKDIAATVQRSRRTIYYHLQGARI